MKLDPLAIYMAEFRDHFALCVEHHRRMLRPQLPDQIPVRGQRNQHDHIDNESRQRPSTYRAGSTGSMGGSPIQGDVRIDQDHEVMPEETAHTQRIEAVVHVQPAIPASRKLRRRAGGHRGPHLAAKSGEKISAPPGNPAPRRVCSNRRERPRRIPRECGAE